MTHLGQRLTALVDGELGHAERDKALVHLAACDQCRAEADALRVLKRRLRAMGDALPADSLIQRLQAMGEPGDPLPPAIRRLPGQSRTPSPAKLTRPRDTRPPARGRAAAGRRRLPRGRYLVAGAAALAVLGIGSAAFAAGSEPRSPRVSPSIEQFAVEHALTSGDVPLTDPKPAETSDSP